MKSSCLLAYKKLTPSTKGSLIDLDEEEEAPIKQYQLASASQVVVLDDIISYRLFKEHLMCAPEEDALETFYLQLGAQRLSSLVQEDVRIGNHTTNQQKADRLRKHVLERSKIFLYEYANHRRDGIKHDTKWLEKNLRIEMVRSVALRRSLKDHRQSQTEKRSAAGAHEKGSWVLYVADEGRPDMYQVGQAVCQMLLSRPNQQAYLFFEPFLTLDLLGLRARGYNVDRILRAKAAEARLAEEQRQKALEEEERMIREREQTWAQQGKKPEPPRAAEAAREVAKAPVMPGGWSNEPATESSNSTKKSGGLFSSLGRRLGLDGYQSDQQGQGPKAPEGCIDGPAPSGPSAQGQQAGTGSRPDEADGRVTSPAVVQQNLLNAIKVTSAHGSDSVFSQPTVSEVKEQATYCDHTAATNIVFAAEASNGIKVYVAKDAAGDQMTKFLSANSGAINAFAALLVEAGAIYSLAPHVLHIFHDKVGGTVAFNTGGSIFCNLRFFLQLHAAGMNGPSPGAEKAEAATWWWVVLAHELAHNLVSSHNSEHSYYT